MKCSICTNKQNLKVKTLSKYRYKECGLDNVILCNIKTSVCNKCGEVYYHFMDIEELHKLIAYYLVKKVELLTGREIKFLRKYLGYSASTFSKLIGYEAEHLSRLENEKAKIQKIFDRLVRSLVLEQIPGCDDNLHNLFLEDKLIKIKWLEFHLSSNKLWSLKKAS